MTGRGINENILCFVVLTGACACSFSWGVDPYGLYIGGDFGNSKIKRNWVRGSAAGKGFTIGYKVGDHLSYELGHLNFGDAAANVDGVGVSKLKSKEWQVTALAELPFGARFGIYGRLGYSRGYERVTNGVFSSRSTSSGLIYGAGFLYAISEKVRTHIEVQKPTSDITSVSVGARYKL